MDRRETYSFGEDLGEPFRLETRHDAQGHQHLRLFHGANASKDVHEKSLRLLRYLAANAGVELLEVDILEALWPGDGEDQIVEKHISFLRKVLGDTDANNRRFIATIHRHGYKFLPKVRKEGDFGGIEAFPKWDRARFYELLGKIERGGDSATEDLRIVTTGFNSGISELDLEGLLKRHVRVKIVMMNPDNPGLIDARYSLRKDRTKQRAVRELKEQIDEIKNLMLQYPPDRSGRGTLELGLSDTMPCGFVIHSSEWALLGVFLAHDSYVSGPMLQIRSDTELWQKLRADWEARWKASHNPARKKDKAG